MTDVPPPQTKAPTAVERHLFGPGPKRILALDGGGVRGVLSLAILAKIEQELGRIHGAPVRLCDYFDLIGGTSTGAIIATGLALGHSVSELRDFYRRLAPQVFKKPFFRLPGWQAQFDAEALRRQLIGIIGDRTLDTKDLQTGLAITLKRIDAASSWILTNNPASKFWESPTDNSFLGNRHYSLANIVRASTAAPHYFDPQSIAIGDGMPPALFVDGGLTPHNDPSLALLLLAALPGYGLNWPLSPDKLTIVSVGAGGYRDRHDARALLRASSITIALRSLMQQIGDNQALTLSMMSWLGAGGGPDWPINSEIGSLAGVTPPFGALFKYRRYDVRFEKEWLETRLGIKPTEIELAMVRRMDDPRGIPLLEKLGERAGERLVDASQFDAYAPSPAAKTAGSP